MQGTPFHKLYYRLRFSAGEECPLRVRLLIHMNQDISAALAFLKRVAKFSLYLFFQVSWNPAACPIAGAIPLRLRRRAPQFRWHAALNIDAKLVFVTRAAAKNCPYTLFLPHCHISFIPDGSYMLPIRKLLSGSDICDA